MMMKRIYQIMGVLLALSAATSLFAACSADEDEENTVSRTALYAILKPDEGQNADAAAADYVLTLDNIIAVNPKTLFFKMQDVQRIDEKAFPTPTQHSLLFYSKGEFLFEAKLNSMLSSMMTSGLTFYYYWGDKKGGISHYKLEAIRFIELDGTIDGELTDKQKQGISRMFEILKKAGKTTDKEIFDL